MPTSQSFSGFCVFCYQSIYSCAKSEKSTESLVKFTKFVGRYTGQNILEKLAESDQLEIKQNLRLECCNKCNLVIDGFCKYYSQFEVLELHMKCKLDQISGIIKHFNRVPSRWKNLNIALEERFPDDLEMRHEGQDFIRKFRQSVGEICHQIKLPQPHVLLEKDDDFATKVNLKTQTNLQTNDDEDSVNFVLPEGNTTSDMEIEPEVSDNDNDEESVKSLDHGKSLPLLDPLLQIKREAAHDRLPSDDDDEELPNAEHINLFDNKCNDEITEIESQISTSSTSEHKRVEYKLRDRVRSKKVELENTNSDYDENDSEFFPESTSERESDDDNNFSGSEDYEDKVEEVKKETPKNNNEPCPNNHTDESGKQICGECNIVFSSEKDLWVHRSKDHENTVCTECGKEIGRRIKLKLHLNCHKNSKGIEVVCFLCDRKFRNIRALNFHLITCKRKHGSVKEEKNRNSERKRDYAYRCNTCQKTFLTLQVFKNHQNSHVKTEFKCEFCPHVERNVLKLSTHEYQNHCPDEVKEQDGHSIIEGEKVSFHWSCPRCQYKSVSCPDYQFHFAQVHSKLNGDYDNFKKLTSKPKRVKRFACPKCEICFEHVSDYESHQKNSHPCSNEDTDEAGIWTCADCNIIFTNEKILWGHRSKDHEYTICTECGKEFTKRLELKRHLNFHENLKACGYSCHFCDQNFRTLIGLNSHLNFCKRKHGIEKDKKGRTAPKGKRKYEFRCSSLTCKKTFQSLKIFKNHMNSHVESKFKCEFCPHVETNVLKLSSHEYQNHCPDEIKEQDRKSIVGDNNLSFRWSCPRCQYKSDSCPDYQFHFAQAHFKLDGDNRIYQCDKCDRRFNIKFDFKLHTTTHSNEKHFLCQFCGAGFKCKGQMNKHCVMRHTTDLLAAKTSGDSDKLNLTIKRNTCEICDRLMYSFSRKVKHLKVFHGLPGKTDKSEHFNCEVDGCTAYFLTQNQLLYHQVRKHQYKLEKCKIKK